jgi:hypothetical protein
VVVGVVKAGHHYAAAQLNAAGAEAGQPAYFGGGAYGNYPFAAHG